MQSYRFRPKPGFQSYGTKAQQRLLFVGLVLVLAAAIALGILYSAASARNRQAQRQYVSRVSSNLVDAIGQTSRMASGVQSNSSMKLGQIRQHVYAMDQINNISLAVSGEGGRIIPQEALTALYSVLDRYEAAVQTATGNTLELRTLLLTHLMSLQELLDRDSRL